MCIRTDCSKGSEPEKTAANAVKSGTATMSMNATCTQTHIHTYAHTRQLLLRSGDLAECAFMHACVCFNRPYRAYRQGTRPGRAHKSGQDKAGEHRQTCVCVSGVLPHL